MAKAKNKAGASSGGRGATSPGSMKYNPTGHIPELSKWSSAGWGKGWASTPGGVARQMGLDGRAAAEFARFVNAQKRLYNEQTFGGDWGYNPEFSGDNMPSWIKQLYESQGASGVSQATGKSGVGKYVEGSPGAAGDYNAMLQQQQASNWAAMDAMNSEFIRATEQARYRGGIFTGGAGTQDQAQVRRNKKRRTRAGTSTNTGLSIGGSTGAGGVSMGGATNGKSLGIN